MIRRAGEHGVKEVVIGMAHRGRLNVLVNTLGKPPRKLFDEFEGKFEHADDDRAHTGDVKYHMGFSRRRRHARRPGAPRARLQSLAPGDRRPGGRRLACVRARPAAATSERKQVLPVLMHGDAAFAGQGVVMELFQMSQARGFARRRHACTSSSTTRSASPPAPPTTRARRCTAPTWPRWSARRCCT